MKQGSETGVEREEREVHCSFTHRFSGVEQCLALKAGELQLVELPGTLQIAIQFHSIRA
jgi:hypothetical protein